MHVHCRRDYGCEFGHCPPGFGESACIRIHWRARPNFPECRPIGGILRSFQYQRIWELEPTEAHLTGIETLTAESQLTDAQIIDAVVAGDADAYGQLVSRYQDRLFHSLVRVTGSREEAEDVAQESFVQAFVKLSTFQGKSQFFTWLYRIAFNTSISRNRRKRPVASVDAIADASGAEPVDQSHTASDQIAQQERIAAVHVALGELTEDYRKIIVLKDLEDCSYESISGILGIPVGTVRSRLHRARVQLRDVLKRSEQFS